MLTDHPSFENTNDGENILTDSRDKDCLSDLSMRLKGGRLTRAPVEMSNITVITGSTAARTITRVLNTIFLVVTVLLPLCCSSRFYHRLAPIAASPRRRITSHHYVYDHMIYHIHMYLPNDYYYYLFTTRHVARHEMARHPKACWFPMSSPSASVMSHATGT